MAHQGTVRVGAETRTVDLHHYSMVSITSGQVIGGLEPGVGPRIHDAHVVVWDGRVFRTLRATRKPIIGRRGYEAHLQRASGLTLYHPVHSLTTVEDVEGAIYAHDNGESWEFAHCTPEQHFEFAAVCEDFAGGRFRALVDRALAKRAGATNSAAQAAAMKRYEAIEAFAEAVRAEASRAVLAANLGHFHRPGADSVRTVAAAAVKTVLAAWKAQGLTDATVKARRALVATDAAAVVTALERSVTLVTRVSAAQAAADAAKAKAATETEAAS